ncbi:MAG: hypothetical protein NTZ44_00075 [Candidatus Nomurabacteria bacterium]|nr:hypothetical protein [Candidatus Nomurabacteria bacterium]
MENIKIDGMEEGLPPIQGDVNIILENIIKTVEGEILENKALENKNGIENSIQKLNRLKNELNKIYKKQGIEEKRDEIIKKKMK